MSNRLAYGVTAALALGLAATPLAQTDQDVVGVQLQATEAPVVKAVAVDDRDPGPVRAAPLAAHPVGFVSDADADARFEAGLLVFEADVSSIRLGDGRDGAVPVARSLVAYEGPLLTGREGLAPDPLALAKRAAYEPYTGPLDNGRPPGTRPGVVADQEPVSPETARAAPAVVEGADGLALAFVRPNPTRGRAEITFSVETPTAATVRVFDMTGREVVLLYDRSTPADALQTVVFDAATVAPGAYVVVLEADGRRTTQTFQVVR